MTALAEALVAAQAEMPAVEPNQENPHFRSKFVSLDHLIAKTRPVLNRHGLAIVQLPATSELGAPVLRTILIHGPSGEQITADTPLILGKQDMQSFGAAITYARRYAWSAALGIAADEDQDGHQPQGSVAGEPAAAPAAATEEPPVDMNDPSIPFGDAPPPPRAQKTVTAGMKTALDTLVGKLRDEGGYITTEQLYGGIATLRGVETDELILQIGGVDDQGVLRWRRLRDSLTRPEAQKLREWLARKQAQLETEAEQSPFTPPAGTPVPFDE